jgi:ribonuclease J
MTTDNAPRPERPESSFGHNNRRPSTSSSTRSFSSANRRPSSVGPKRRNMSHRRDNRMTLQKQDRKPDDKFIPSPGENIRIITLGGVEEIGRNMTAIEYKDDIIVIDAGFMFKEEETPGIDYILPNTKYLEERKDKIRALIITHGHLDHIGGLPYIIDRIGNPPIYTRNLTSIMIQKRQTEFPHLEALNIKIVEKDDRIKVGNLSVRFFSVTHTIPDSMGIIIETPFGSIVTPGDFKLNHFDGIALPEEEKEYDFFKDEKVLLLLADSTNVENPGFSTPESVVHKNLEEIIKNIKGRLIIGTFASQLARLIKIINICEQLGKKIAVEGRSMKVNIEIAELAGMLKVKKDTIINSQDIESYPPDKVIVLSTGAQGEEFAALMRIATGNHKTIKLSKRDTVLLSSSIVPGNEKSVQKLKDNLARQGAHIIHFRTSDVYIHSTGHGNRGELEWLHKKIKPKFFVPIHGHHYHLKLHAELAESLGMKEGTVVIPETGSLIELSDNGEKITSLPMKAPSGLMLVDGFAVGNMQEVVLRDRQMLAQDGVFVVFAVINLSTGTLRKSPDIISRGFVYLRESQELLRQARFIIKKNIEDLARGMNPINFDYIKDIVTDEISRFLFQKTAKRPIVIPVLVGM